MGPPLSLTLPLLALLSWMTAVVASLHRLGRASAAVCLPGSRTLLAAAWLTAALSSDLPAALHPARLEA